MVARFVRVDDAVDCISILADDTEDAVGGDGRSLGAGGSRRVVEMRVYDDAVTRDRIRDDILPSARQFFVQSVY